MSMRKGFGFGGKLKLTSKGGGGAAKKKIKRAEVQPDADFSAEPHVGEGDEEEDSGRVGQNYAISIDANEGGAELNYEATAKNLIETICLDFVTKQSEKLQLQKELYVVAFEEVIADAAVYNLNKAKEILTKIFFNANGVIAKGYEQLDLDKLISVFNFNAAKALDDSTEFIKLIAEKPHMRTTVGKSESALLRHNSSTSSSSAHSSATSSSSATTASSGEREKPEFEFQIVKKLERGKRSLEDFKFFCIKSNSTNAIGLGGLPMFSRASSIQNAFGADRIKRYSWNTNQNPDDYGVSFNGNKPIKAWVIEDATEEEWLKMQRFVEVFNGNPENLMEERQANEEWLAKTYGQSASPSKLTPQKPGKRL